MKKILFADDDQNLLNGMRRTFRDLRGEWALAFAQSGEEALGILKKVAFDVLVADVRIQGTDGQHLIAQVKNELPDVVRIGLSGQADLDSVMKSEHPAHQFLTKPYSSEKLKTLLLRTLALRDRMADAMLQKVISRIETLPSMPALYAELMSELSSEDASIQRVGEIISCDMGMMAQILKLVNSAVFGCRTTIESPAQAVGLLGLEMVKGLVLSVQVFSQVDASLMGDNTLSSLWNHSMEVGVFARDMARKEGADKALVGEAFMAGMLHDAGKLLLATNFVESYRTALTLAQEERIPLWKAEMELFETSHAEIGAYLLGLWGLPDAIVEALAFHHCPGESGCLHVSPLTYVHCANVLGQEAEDETEGDDDRAAVHSVLDEDYLTLLGIEDKIPSWRDVCRPAEVV